MKNISKYIGSAALGVAVCTAGALVASCADDWDDHYTGVARPTQTLWQTIQSRPDLADFARLLQAKGYDKYLNSDQSYTVWAPVGSIDTTLVTGEDMSEEEILSQVVENHIAHGMIAASTVVNDTVLVLNGKRMPFVAEGGVPGFNGTPVSEYNIECSNGELHILSGQAPYNNNIWTYLRQDAGFSDIADYLYSFNEWVFDPDASTVSGVVDGERVYSDSVFVLENQLWEQIGDLNDESRIYTMLVPTNAAWQKMLTDYKKFFNYEEGNDSLAEAYASRAIVDNLIFEQNSQTYLPDWISTGGNIFTRPYEDGGIFSHVDDSVGCSNGVVYKSSDIYMDPYETMVEEIIIEAEDEERYLVGEGRQTSGTRVFVAAANTGVSGSYYMQYTTTSVLSTQPNMTFALPDMYSCAYDIGVVFIPQNLTGRGWVTSIDQKPNLVEFTLEDDNTGEELESGEVEVPGTAVDTIWVARGYEFQYCDYFPDRTDLSDAPVRLTISNAASRSDSKYTRTLNIDCIILKPSNENAGNEE